MLFHILSLIHFVSGQDDGNPHGWDRVRRCDTFGYNPPCGICEGVGGVPFGDKPDDYYPTGCTKVAGPSEIDPSTLKRPDWAVQWYSHEYYGVLIGPKNDPFCFQVFPSNSSQGDLCYQPQQGPQAYDMTKSFALRYDLQIATVVGNITSKIIHQDIDFWVVNKFPWYLGGFTQCICTTAKEGGVGAPVYPLMYNWTDNLSFIGREKLDVEYIWKKGVVLDHWGYGPHHIWSEPETGKLIRMWQPFNGLQVFPEGTSISYVDPSNFTNLPPPECKKGGALMRIKCTDDGYPQGANDTEIAGKDLHRAKNPVPAHDFRGDSFEQMSEILNGHLQNTGAKTKECEDFTHQELQELQQLFHQLAHGDFDDIYKLNNDPRQIFDLRDFSDINGLAKKFDLEHIVRDGHCHEAVMWFVHHLTEDVKQMLIDHGVVIPLLSYGRHSMPDDISEHEAKIYNVYDKQVTCLDCHANYKPPRHLR